MDRASAFVAGLALGLGLIAVIGAQNAFVLRQGLRREHVGLVVAFCAAADAALIALGVGGLGSAIGALPGLVRALAAFGVIFLGGYGLRALWRAFRPGTLVAAGGAPISRRQALAQAAGFTLLNPHVYLDTVLLVGSVGAQQPGAVQKLAFAIGAASASVLWFSGLGYGARALAPWFAKPRAWQVLDALVGVVLLVMAAWLLPIAFGTTIGT